MRNLMLSLNSTSNDGSLQHKPTLALAGLDRRSRPFAVPQKVRFQAALRTMIFDRVGWSAVCPVRNASLAEADVQVGRKPAGA
jgi:hypothetical protein